MWKDCCLEFADETWQMGKAIGTTTVPFPFSNHHNDSVYRVMFQWCALAGVPLFSGMKRPAASVIFPQLWKISVLGGILFGLKYTKENWKEESHTKKTKKKERKFQSWELYSSRYKIHIMQNILEIFLKTHSNVQKGKHYKIVGNYFTWKWWYEK